MSRDLWVFGYGSLVWRPDIPYAERIVADLPGLARRFWQGSTDHRGVPGAPGRVVTLVEEDEAAPCRGVAYRIRADDVDAVIARLDHREQGGYLRLEVELCAVGLVPGDQGEPQGERLPASVYVADPRNPNWLGPAPVEAIAAQVLRSRGPSGRNVDYVLELERALERLGRPDPHVRAIADALRAARTE